MASSKAPQAADESSSKKGRVNLAALTAHTFEEVTAARGERWAEGTIKALQQKERAQAVQIMELKRELEAAKAQAAKREAKKKSDEPIEAADEGAPPEAEQDGPSELELLRQHAESLAAELAHEKGLRQSDAERMREEAAAECRTERERLGERYEQRLHTATAVQRSLEERLREQQQQLAAAQQLLAEQARPPSVETRREHAATQRENEALRAEVEGLRDECAQLRQRLSGFNGKLKTLKDEFAQSERQASEEERQLALMLREAHSEKNGLQQEDKELAHTLAAARRARLQQEATQGAVSKATKQITEALLAAGPARPLPKQPPAPRPRAATLDASCSLSATPRGAAPPEPPPQNERPPRHGRRSAPRPEAEQQARRGRARGATEPGATLDEDEALDRQVESLRRRMMGAT